MRTMVLLCIWASALLFAVDVGARALRPRSTNGFLPTKTAPRPTVTAVWNSSALAAIRRPAPSTTCLGETHAHQPTDEETMQSYETQGLCFGYYLEDRDGSTRDKALAPCKVWCGNNPDSVGYGCPLQTVVLKDVQDKSTIYRDDVCKHWSPMHCQCDFELAEDILAIVAEGLSHLQEVICSLFATTTYTGNFRCRRGDMPGVGEALGVASQVADMVVAAKTFAENGLDAGSMFGGWIGTACPSNDVASIPFDPIAVFAGLVAGADSMGVSLGCLRKNKAKCVKPKDVPDPTPPPKDKPDPKPTDKPTDKPDPTPAPTQTKGTGNAPTASKAEPTGTDTPAPTPSASPSLTDEGEPLESSFSQPTKACSLGSGSKSKRAGCKSVPDLEAQGYQIQLTSKSYDPEYPDAPIYEIRGSAGELVNAVSIIPEANQIRIHEAKNKLDQGRNPNALRLRDIMLGFWKAKAPAPVSQIRTFHYTSVIEDGLYDLQPEIYSKLGKNPWDNITLNADSTGVEKECFDQVYTATPFAQGVRKLLEEYAELGDRKIKSFDFVSTYSVMKDPEHKGEGMFNFSVNLL